MPPELLRCVREDWPAIVPRYADVLIAGDGAAPAACRLLLLWGARDELPGSNLRAAVRLHAGLSGSTLCVLREAGHFPQLECPERFVAELERFVALAEHAMPDAHVA